MKFLSDGFYIPENEDDFYSCENSNEEQISRINAYPFHEEYELLRTMWYLLQGETFNFVCLPDLVSFILAIYGLTIHTVLDECGNPDTSPRRMEEIECHLNASERDELMNQQGIGHIGFDMDYNNEVEEEEEKQEEDDEEFLNREQVLEIKTTFKMFYLNKFRRDQTEVLSKRNEVHYQDVQQKIKPRISAKTTKLADDYKKKIKDKANLFIQKGWIKEYIDLDGITHQELMVLNKKLQQLEHKNMQIMREQEKSEECTFTPNIYSHKKMSHWNTNHQQYKTRPSHKSNKTDIEKYLDKSPKNDDISDYNGNGQKYQRNTIGHTNQINNNTNMMNPINQDPNWFDNQGQQFIQNEFENTSNNCYNPETENQMYEENQQFSDNKNYHEIYSNEIYSTAKKNFPNTAEKNSISKISRNQFLMQNNQNIISIKEEVDEIYGRDNEIKSSRSHYLRPNDGMVNINSINKLSLVSERGSSRKLNGSVQKNNMFTKNSSHVHLGTNNKTKYTEGHHDNNYINIENETEKYVSFGEHHNKLGFTSQNSYHNGKMLSFGDSGNNSNYNRISQNQNTLAHGNRSKDGSKQIMMPIAIPEQNLPYDFQQEIQQQRINGFYTPQIVGKNYYPSPNTMNGKNYSNKKLPVNQNTFQCHLNFNSTDKKPNREVNMENPYNLNIGSAERKKGLETMPAFSERARSDHEEPTLIDINTKDGVDERIKVTKSDLNDPTFVDRTIQEFINKYSHLTDKKIIK